MMATAPAKEFWFRDCTLSVGTRSNYSCKDKSIMRGLAYHRRIYRDLEGWALFQPDQDLIVEPWLREARSRRCLQPDAVIVHPSSNSGIVIEVKLNWKDGRDEKLINEYLAAVESAFGLDMVWPALITSNVRGLKHPARLGLSSLLGCADWAPGNPTPVILMP
jgi:hypothetical protein